MFEYLFQYISTQFPPPTSVSKKRRVNGFEAEEGNKQINGTMSETLGKILTLEHKKGQADETTRK